MAMTMTELFYDPQTYISLLSLTFLEIVLGIDNIIFISILAGKLPEESRNRVRTTGLIIALFGRLALLSGIAWLTRLTQPWIQWGVIHMSGKDIVLLLGGFFLIWKSAQEIYHKVEGDPAQEVHKTSVKAATFKSVILQIVLIDVVFSLDSIITAVGLVQHIALMVIAILISLGVMIVSANSIGNFIDKHPALKVLALSFLLMIGTLLIAEAFHHEIPKGYVYFALAFSLLVEAINIKAGHRQLSKRNSLSTEVK
jgi:predicted tellurium resistance membrane protein TerC